MSELSPFLSSEPFQKMLSLIPDLVSFHDREMNIICSNWKGFGAVPEEKRILNTKCYRTYRGYDHVCPDCKLQSLFKTKEAFQKEERLPEGIWVDWRGIPILDDDKNVEFVMEWVRDITSQKQKEKELAESEKKERTIIEILPDIIFKYSKYGRYIDIGVPAESEHELPVPKEELLKKELSDIFPSETASYILNAIEKAIDTGELQTIEYELELPETKAVFEGRVLKLNEGEVIAFVRNITDRKQAEAVLQASEARYRRLFESACDGILILDAETDEVIDVNPYLLRLLGYDRNSLLGKKLWDVGPFRDIAGSRGLFRELQEREYVRYEHLPLQNASGGLVDVEFVSNVYRANGNRVIQCNIRDITDRKRAEKDLQESVEQLELMTESAILALAGAVDLRDPYTAGHQRKVAHLAVAIAQRRGLEAERILTLRLAAMVHDAGKIQVPAEILSRPGKLNNIEMSLIREHPKIGHDLFRKSDFGWPLAEIIYQHHERLDGSGYPRGLKEEDISLEAKILAVADVVEAMSSRRPYREALGVKAALAEIEQNSGRLYDPEIVRICIALFGEGFEFEE